MEVYKGTHHQVTLVQGSWTLLAIAELNHVLRGCYPEQTGLGVFTALLVTV